jgi:hypothetical protein
MDTDIEVGRLVTHGAIVGVGKVAHEAIEANDSLSPAERALRHAFAAALETISHAVTEAAAEAIDQRRHGS